jgi:phage shock protein PspC (stress-responsive transcriptional regulator)
MKDNGLVIVSIVGTLVLIGLIIYLVVWMRRSPRAVVNAETDEVSQVKGSPD